MASEVGSPANFFHSDPRAAARRAAVLMYLLGALGIFGGICLGVVGLALKDVMTQPEFARVLRFPVLAFPQLQAWLVAAGMICFIGGFLMAASGWFVRKGTFVPIVVAIVVAMIAMVITGFIFVATLLVVQTQNDVTIVSVEWMLALPVLLLVVLLIWLTAALHSVEDLRNLEGRIHQPRMDTNEHE